MKFNEKYTFIGKTEVALCFNGEFYHAKVLNRPEIRAIGKTMDEVLYNLESEMQKRQAA